MRKIQLVMILFFAVVVLSAGEPVNDELWNKYRYIKSKNKGWKPGLIETKQITRNKKGAVQDSSWFKIRYEITPDGIESIFMDGVHNGVSMSEDDPMVESFQLDDNDDNDESEEMKDLKVRKTNRKQTINNRTCIGYDVSFKKDVNVSKDDKKKKMKEVKEEAVYWLCEKSGALMLAESIMKNPPIPMVKEMKTVTYYDYNDKGEWKPIDLKIDIKIKILLMTVFTESRTLMSKHFKKPVRN